MMEQESWTIKPPAPKALYSSYTIYKYGNRIQLNTSEERNQRGAEPAQTPGILEEGQDRLHMGRVPAGSHEEVGGAYLI